jgi:hypothetical protein
MALHTINPTNFSASPTEAISQPSGVGRSWHQVHRLLRTLSGAVRVQEERYTVTNHAPTSGVATLPSGSGSGGKTGVPGSASNTGSPSTGAGDSVKRSIPPESDSPNAPVCELCQAPSCVITRRAPAGRTCLCTLELHVPLDGSGNTAFRLHECASCQTDQYVEMERQRKRRAERGLFAPSSLVS